MAIETNALGSRLRHAVSDTLGLPLRALDSLGHMGEFYLQAFAWIPRTVTSHKREQVRVIAEVGMGTGALALIGGAVAITGFMTFFAGTIGGVQGYQGLREVGLTPLSGFVSAYINTRLSAPVIAGASLAATVGTGMTAQIGAMRVNEEIDALEVMGVPALPYLVTTRLIASFIAIIPLYSLALIFSYVGFEAVAVMFYHVSPGGYSHYFYTFLNPTDILYSFYQALAMSVVVALVHTYYGYYASGGPAGVGEAVGKAVRSSLIGVTVVNLAVAMAIYGSTQTFHISG
jgi:phospholipid/cholesterol/gamma-HCH transport system permease protein